MRKFKRRSADYAQISMLNLIDVIFILLIFFMLSTTFKKLWQFDVNLPAAYAQNTSVSRFSCTLQLLADGSAYWLDEGIKRSLDENAYAHLKECTSLELSADKSLAYERVIWLIGELANHEITAVKLNIERN